MEEKNLCDRCKAELDTKPDDTGSIFGPFIGIIIFVFLVWCIGGFMRDCGMATCGRLM